jgi:hypothetical protein
MATITPLFKNGSFDPDVTKAMAEAYDHACQHLNGGANDRVKETIAKTIIHLAQTGVHDPIVLRDRALEALRDR